MILIIPWEIFLWCHFSLLLLSVAFRNCKNVFNIYIYIKITSYPVEFHLNTVEVAINQCILITDATICLQILLILW